MSTVNITSFRSPHATSTILRSSGRGTLRTRTTFARWHHHCDPIIIGTFNAEGLELQAKAFAGVHLSWQHWNWWLP
jgi:hypothetical protein